MSSHQLFCGAPPKILLQLNWRIPSDSSDTFCEMLGLAWLVCDARFHDQSPLKFRDPRHAAQTRWRLWNTHDLPLANLMWLWLSWPCLDQQWLQSVHERSKKQTVGHTSDTIENDKHLYLKKKKKANIAYEFQRYLTSFCYIHNQLVRPTNCTCSLSLCNFLFSLNKSLRLST